MFGCSWAMSIPDRSVAEVFRGRWHLLLEIHRTWHTHWHGSEWSHMALLQCSKIEVQEEHGNWGQRMVVLPMAAGTGPVSALPWFCYPGQQLAGHKPSPGCLTQVTGWGWDHKLHQWRHKPLLGTGVRCCHLGFIHPSIVRIKPRLIHVRQVLQQWAIP
jgi:hypothetical protein